MRSGSLRRVITIERATSTINDHGTPITTWADLATLRAELVQMNTVEQIRRHGASDETGVIFRTRWIAGITNADRIRFDGREFNIKEVIDLGRRGGLELRAEALD